MLDHTHCERKFTLAFYEAQHAKSTCSVSISSELLYIDWAFIFLLHNICCHSPRSPLLNIQGLTKVNGETSGSSISTLGRDSNTLWKSAHLNLVALYALPQMGKKCSWFITAHWWSVQYHVKWHNSWMVVSWYATPAVTQTNKQLFFFLKEPLQCHSCLQT